MKTMYLFMQGEKKKKAVFNSLELVALDGY